MDFTKHTYTVTKVNKTDPTLTVIEKGNITSDFTIADFKRNIIDLEKTCKELKSKYEHERLLKKAIEVNDPIVKELTEFQRLAVVKYVTACEVVKQYKPKIKEFEEALEIEKAELEYVTKNVLNEEIS